jgi:hypothetical protein
MRRTLLFLGHDVSGGRQTVVAMVGWLINTYLWRDGECAQTTDQLEPLVKAVAQPPWLICEEHLDLFAVPNVYLCGSVGGWACGE